LTLNCGRPVQDQCDEQRGKGQADRDFRVKVCTISNRVFRLSDSVFDAIRDEPEFQPLIDEISADMTDQLAWLRKKEEAGELAAIPESLK